MLKSDNMSHKSHCLQKGVLLRRWSYIILVWTILLQFAACSSSELEFAIKHLHELPGERLVEVVSYKDEVGLDNTNGITPLEVQVQFERKYRYIINEQLTSNDISGQRVRDKIGELYRLPPNDPEGTVQGAKCPISVVIPAGKAATITVEWIERWAEGVINEGRDGDGRSLGSYAVFLGYGEPCSLVSLSTEMGSLVSTTVQPTPDVSVALPTVELTHTGRLETTYPLQLKVDQSAVVTLEIIADSSFTEIGQHPEFATGTISIETKSQIGSRFRLEEEVALYPIMSAELIASNFNVSNTSFSPRRRIGPTTSAVWIWELTANQAGKQPITINIYGHETVGDGVPDVLVKVLTRSVDVRDPNALSKLAEYLSGNWIQIFGTSGPLALVIVYLTFRITRKSGQLNKAIQQSKSRAEVPSSAKDRSE